MRMKDEDWERCSRSIWRAISACRRAAHARDDEAPLRPDHRHHLGGRRHRQSRPGQLRRLQGRHDRLVQGAGPGGRHAATSP